MRERLRCRPECVAYELRAGKEPRWCGQREETSQEGPLNSQYHFQFPQSNTSGCNQAQVE